MTNGLYKPFTGGATSSGLYGNIGVATSYDFQAKPLERVEVPKSSYQPLNRNIESIGAHGAPNYEFHNHIIDDNKYNPTLLASSDFKRVHSEVAYNPAGDVPKDYSIGHTPVNRYDDLLRDPNDHFRGVKEVMVPVLACNNLYNSLHITHHLWLMIYPRLNLKEEKST